MVCEMLELTAMKISPLRLSLFASIAVACCSTVSVATASTVTVLPSTTTLDQTHWSSAFLGDNSGGGNSTITATAPHDGNGSIELFGDRTRFVNGNYYAGASAPSQGLLSNVQSLTFDWSVAVGSSAGSLISAYTPALILYVQDGTSRSQLIWEGAYNGYTDPSSVTKGTWYTSGANDRFYKNGDNDPNTAPVLADFATLVTRYGYSSNAYISAIGVGVGSTASSSYHAFADDITLTTKSGVSTTYNFETNAPASGPSVPDTGSTLALLGLAAFVLVGARQKVCG